MDRRASTGLLFWRRDASKVKFRHDVEVHEYVKDPREHQSNYQDTVEENRLTSILIVAATCVAAACATVVIPYLLLSHT